MKRTPIDSSGLASIGYDAKTKTLEVKFNHGGVYQYFGIPTRVHSALMKAESHGTYFMNHIRNAGYAFRHVS